MIMITTQTLIDAGLFTLKTAGDPAKNIGKVF